MKPRTAVRGVFVTLILQFGPEEGTDPEIVPRGPASAKAPPRRNRLNDVIRRPARMDL
jgi:hypothetical protein